MSLYGRGFGLSDDARGFGPDGRRHRGRAISFQANGAVVKFPGFTVLYEEEEEEKVEKLPQLKKGDSLKPGAVTPNQHFTQPPPRYTEATLVKELEENGIGRPSTYASIISTIQDREYVSKEKAKLGPTELGFLVTDMLVESFPEILDAAFTARMEEELDEVEDGSMDWRKVMEEFYGPFSQSLEKAQGGMRDIKRRSSDRPRLPEVRKTHDHKMGQERQFPRVYRIPGL